MIFIAVPAYGQMMNSQTAVSLVALTAELANNNLFHSICSWSHPDIVEIRNKLLSHWFYKLPTSTHLLFVDADMQFERGLVRDMLLADKQLVGCLYPKKRLPISWVGSPLTPEAQPEGNLLQVEGLGCGVMLIRRDCVEGMIELGIAETDGETILAFDKVKNEEGRQLSEDFSFCYRHRKAGGEVWAVINHVLCHIGLHQYASRYSDMYEVKSDASSS